MLIKKSAVTAPSLPFEVVTVQELKGDVMVRGLTLGARMTLSQKLKDQSKTLGFDHLAPLLELSVVDADGASLFTAEQWDAWGAVNMAAALKLWDIAWRLSDMDGKVAEKNEKAPTSD